MTITSIDHVKQRGLLATRVDRVRVARVLFEVQEVVATRFYSACLCALILLKKVDAVAYLIGSVASFLWIPRGLALLLGEGRRISTAHRISHQVQQLLTCY